MARNNRDYVDKDTPKEEVSASSRSGEDQDVHSSNVMTGDDGDDERLSGGVDRGTRASDARELESRELTQDEQRIAAFRESVFSSALPDLPKKEGFHNCWLTTTNPRDTIVMRERLGYELIKVEDEPGFEHSAIREGVYKGYIGVNEMVAARIPTHLYMAYMQEAHHNAPKSEEERLKAQTKDIAAEAKERSGKEPLIGDGTLALGKAPARGRFQDL